MYILVVEYTSSETSVEEFTSIDDIKKHLEKSKYILQFNFYIAKVIATQDSIIEDIKEE